MELDLSLMCLWILVLAPDLCVCLTMKRWMTLGSGERFLTWLVGFFTQALASMGAQQERCNLYTIEVHWVVAHKRLVICRETKTGQGGAGKGRKGRERRREGGKMKRKRRQGEGQMGRKRRGEECRHDVPCWVLNSWKQKAPRTFKYVCCYCCPCLCLSQDINPQSFKEKHV